MTTLEEVAAALAKARAKHGPMRGAHEGYAVLLEEVDELWDEVKRRELDPVALRKEALHVAAMAVRFLEDVCGAAAPRGDCKCWEQNPATGFRCFLDRGHQGSHQESEGLTWRGPLLEEPSHG